MQKAMNSRNCAGMGIWGGLNSSNTSEISDTTNYMLEPVPITVTEPFTIYSVGEGEAQVYAIE